ncbi:putative RNA-directed DNA polymerase from transposon X-element [Trichonephila clavipes]|nr:putative RNA-directed DNA polymerase from transposon X-element [Trichonephila clavipes]
MGDDVMEIHASQSDESLMDDLSPKPSSSGSLRGAISQLPAPFNLLGEFNGHSPLWGHDDTNSRGRKIEQLISDHCLCLLNNDEKTYFHAPTRSFHSLDLAIGSPVLLPLLTFEVDQDLHNSDHFPLLVSHVNGAGSHDFVPPNYHFHRADWDKFTRLAIITGSMVQNRAVADAIFNVTEAIRNAADAAIPKTSNSPRKLCKPWWNTSCQQAKKEQRRAWGIFRRYPTTENLIAFKRAKALARRIRRQCQRESWIQYVSSITSSTTSQQLWRKFKAANRLYREFTLPILETSTALYSSPFDVANVIGQTFASVSSSDSYSRIVLWSRNVLIVPSHSSDSKLCPKWKIEKQIQEIKTNNNISYQEARTLIAPQLSQTYAQVAKSSTATSTNQTDENITRIKCPPLQLLQPLLSVPQPNKYPSITSVSTSSSTTQANLETRTLIRSNKSAALSTEIQPLPESDPTASNGEHFNAPEVPQCAKRNSRNRRKRPKVQKAEIKIKMAPHRPRKSTPTELTTDEEDMIMYDVQTEELEPNPEDKFAVMECFVNNPSEYMRSLTPTRFSAFWPMLLRRREAGVSPLLSIGW